MVDPGLLASRLADATDVTSAAEFLAGHLLELVPGGGARVWLFGGGDRCGTCVRARDCGVRDRCLHLEASLGTFARPPGHDERIPRTDPMWVGPAEGRAPETPVSPPPQLEAHDSDEEGGVALLVPLLAGGEVVGVAGLRCPAPPSAEIETAVRIAAFLAASTFRLLLSLEMENRRCQQILLVSDLGRKVNSILDDSLLLKQAAVDIHRTFGFHNVMIFMRQAEGAVRLLLRAQASTYAMPSKLHSGVRLDQGIVGRACVRRATEIVSDVTQDPDFVSWFPDTKSEIAIPIQISGVVEGVLNVESDRIGSFGESERLVLETVANQLAIAIENARLFGMVKEREDRYRVLVESNPGAVIHLDAGGSIVFANPAASELTGREKDDLLTDGMTLTRLVRKESQTDLEEAISDALRGMPRRDVEIEIPHTDGNVRFAQASFQPLFGEQSEPQGVVVLVRDRTREKDLQNRLYQSEKLSAIGGLVSGVAHELNNPLAGIMGFAQLLLSRPTKEWTRRDVEKIEKNARRCRTIVENLLAFARQARLSRRLANLNEIIDSVLRLNEYQFHVDDIEILRDFDMRIPPLQLDVNRWQQVFVNLALNAHQAIVQADSPKRVIRFETRLKEDRVFVRVCDTGPGIPTEKRGRVFEPFFTTKEEGTGLGLGICYGIVTEHGGTIDLETTADEGTCFRISLPIEVQPLMPLPMEAEAKPTPSSTGLGRRILVVDDEEYVRDVIARTLESHHYAVDVVANGVSALQQIREHSYDAVLSDISMPGQYKGVELYDRVQEEWPDLAQRFVFLTGHMHDNALTAQIDARGGRCIEKPFDIHELARVVGKVVAPLPEGNGHRSDVPPHAQA